MRNKNDKQLVVGLDIGTSKVVAIVGEYEPGEPIEVIGIGTHVSRGMKRGSVVDIESTVHSIQRAAEEAALMAGRRTARDPDMQAAGRGMPIDRSELRRGDLVFWKGHVAIVEDPETIIHANGHTMTVARENFEAAVKRIGWLYEQPTGYRRIL